MPITEPLDVLLAHDLWASRQLLTCCAALTEEPFHRRFEIGPGSLHDAATHLVGGMRAWTDMLARRAERPRLEKDGVRRTPGELLALLGEAHEDFAARAREGPAGEMIPATRGGRSYSFSRGAVVTHVATHGTHHRAQCLNMLRRLGVTPLPKSSVLEWMLAGEAG
jgi:uncharacterized damage-inducible protein DinB